MAWDVADFCQTSADEFVSGDLEAMARRHALPLAVYLPDRIRVSLTRDDLLSALGRRRALAVDAGTTSIRVTALVIDALNDERLTLLVEWSFLDVDGRQIASNRMRHYCRRDPEGGLLVEMVEFLRLGFPDPSG